MPFAQSSWIGVDRQKKNASNKNKKLFDVRKWTRRTIHEAVRYATKYNHNAVQQHKRRPRRVQRGPQSELPSPRWRPEVGQWFYAADLSSSGDKVVSRRDLKIRRVWMTRGNDLDDARPYVDAVMIISPDVQPGSLKDADCHFNSASWSAVRGLLVVFGDVYVFDCATDVTPSNWVIICCSRRRGQDRRVNISTFFRMVDGLIKDDRNWDEELRRTMSVIYDAPIIEDCHSISVANTFVVYMNLTLLPFVCVAT
ncbi:hypothetical protein BDZ89DRAFT_1038593 [Hymenopellis radicata]|nr:hypothetical protein BDZ89DRAFT_1038593 [Hymenopellis radicata]